MNKDSVRKTDDFTTDIASVRDISPSLPPKGIWLVNFKGNIAILGKN